MINDLKNDEILEIIERIFDDPSDKIPNDLIRELTDSLSECEVFVPVEDDEIVLYDKIRGNFIPVSCDLKDFRKEFSDKTPEIFRFEHLKEFMDWNMDGIIINPGGVSFILNKFLAEFAFNKNRPHKKVTHGYDVKVRLNDYRPLTWRDLIIPDNITFMELDDILKTLWGFKGSHLSCFLLPDRKNIIDYIISEDSMIDMDYNIHTTLVGDIFDNYKKVTYWYDFGDNWQFDIEIKKKVEYNKDYVTIKRFKGEYEPIEDCNGVYGLSEVVYCAENPGMGDEFYEELVEYLEKFDMEFTQMALERKVYIKSDWQDISFVE